MKDFFSDLLQYNFIYNEKLLHLFTQNEDLISGRAKLLLSHLINAQHLWNFRILQKKHVYGVWETIPLKILREMNTLNLEISNQIIETEDLDKIVDYFNSGGEEYQNKIQDIIFHYLNHSTYHRAQIATELKGVDLEPFNSDFISYKRSL